MHHLIFIPRIVQFCRIVTQFHMSLLQHTSFLCRCRLISRFSENSICYKKRKTYIKFVTQIIPIEKFGLRSILVFNLLRNIVINIKLLVFFKLLLINKQDYIPDSSISLPNQQQSKGNLMTYSVIQVRASALIVLGQENLLFINIASPFQPQNLIYLNTPI